jgi:hypothetical protein
LSPIEFIRFDPSTCLFPKPKLSLLPQLGSSRISVDRKGSWVSILDGRAVNHFSRGRYALFEAYKRVTRGEGLVFLPSYHCRTMVDPAIELGLRVIFYPIDKNLSPDFIQLELLFQSEQRSQNAIPKVMVMPDYFGFIQPMQDIRSICDFYRVKLIEDRSHALLSNTMKPNEQDFGDFIVASPYKFFGSEDGGALVIGRSSLENVAIELDSNSWVHEIKAWARLAWHRLDAFQNSHAIDFLGVSEEIERTLETPGSMGDSLVEVANESSTQFVMAEAKKSSLAASRWLMAHADIDDLACKRRENYIRWLNCVADLPCCNALFLGLPDDCVPYMFPLYLEEPDTHFYLLKRLGVPVGRWDELAVSECQVASRYRKNLIHLPCHQGLDSGAMEWLTTAVSTVMKYGKRRAE